MARTIPLIRAANILPIVRYMEVNRLSAGTYLAQADLSYWYHLSPFSPVPTMSGIRLLRDLARDHGSDVGSKIVNQGTIAELAFIGGVVLGSRTPAEAIQRVCMALPMHSSHEHMAFKFEKDCMVVEHRLHLDLDDQSLHAVQILLLSMLQQVCRFTAMHPPFYSKIEVVPHPVSGLDDFRRLFDADIVANSSGLARVLIREDVARNPFRIVARDRSKTVDVSQIPPLNQDRTLAGSVRPVIDAMLHDSAPTIGRVARAGAMTVRTMQRRLTQEGTSFSDQLDKVRRQLAIQEFATQGTRLSEATERLGYSSPPALARAIRRLTGITPTQLRQLGP